MCDGHGEIGPTAFGYERHFRRKCVGAISGLILAEPRSQNRVVTDEHQSITCSLLGSGDGILQVSERNQLLHVCTQTNEGCLISAGRCAVIMGQL